MKNFLTLALVVGAASWGEAREPMWAPAPSASLEITPTPVTGHGVAMQLSPVPEGGALLPTPVPQPGLIPSGAVVPGQMIPSPTVVQPGVIICDAQLGQGIPLYPAVRVRAPRNIAPCAVEKIVSVPDPCNPCRCVLISICVPPCACERVHCSRDGERVTFDYGKYSVDVTSRRGTLVVHYED